MGQGGGIIGWQFDENWFASYPDSGDHDNNGKSAPVVKIYHLCEFYNA